jgi:hypothetical protein
MRRHKRALTTFVKFLAFSLLLTLSAGLSRAQTPVRFGGAASSDTDSARQLAPTAITDRNGSKKKDKLDFVVSESAVTKENSLVQNRPASSSVPASSPCARTIYADVVAIPQPIMLNRMGAAVPDGLIFALKSDTVTVDGLGRQQSDTVDGLGRQLRQDKRPRPLVLRANVGDCLTITLTNSIPPASFGPPLGETVVKDANIGTQEVSLHVQGMEWVRGSQDDGSFVGKNNSSLASAVPAPSPMPPSTQTYTLYAKAEGTFLLYTMGDTSTQGMQLERGLFGALNVQPEGAEWYRSQITADDLLLATYNVRRLPANTNLNCSNPTNCILKIAGRSPGGIPVIKTPSGYLHTTDNHPLINYDAVYPSRRANGTDIPRLMQKTPILKMLDAKNRIVHSDLTAIITGPTAGRFPGTTGTDMPEPPCNASGDAAPRLANGRIDPLFCANPASPDRKQPYREITILYHETTDGVTVQSFPVFTGPLRETVEAGRDFFSINYGTGGIGPEVYANRIGVGPMGGCVDCKFEEFFLSAWSVGDPAMLVDLPANANLPLPAPHAGLPLCATEDFERERPVPPDRKCANARQPVSDAAGDQPYTLAPLAKATRVFFPDDPSNVYHSYINDHVKFRILHGGTGVTHAHHQHAHQWLQSPNSDQGSYLDSQLISPGASYTLEMVYNGSGNRNKVVGDSIFHCHFYPHFAAGMWAMWRTHDVFESGTFVFPEGTTIDRKDVSGQVVPGSRALPDGEIITGTPTPALVPLPTLPMAVLPAYAQIQTNVEVQGMPTRSGGQVVIGGKCQANRINGLDVIGGCTDGSKLNGTVIDADFDGVQMTGQFQPSARNQLENPGFPYFIPGIAGARAPHPPLDFAPDGVGGSLDGGLPRHLVSGGVISYERHNQFDWSKDLARIDAVKLPEDGTEVEKAAINFFSRRCHQTTLPDGTPSDCSRAKPFGFIVNGLPLGPQSGAPFADPAVDDDGNPVGIKRTYKAAAIQLNVVFNKPQLGWHYQQQRILTLWQDVNPTIKFSRTGSGRRAEPLFFRGNSGDIIEYWHTNLVPNYYLVDDFQVRTPTDILGQHIHLVKFDVTSSDGAGNGFNYEDGTFSPQEVQETIKAINESDAHGFVNFPNQLLTAKIPPKEIIDCLSNPNDERCVTCEKWLEKNRFKITADNRPQCQSWWGAQTTIQRWYLDPLEDNSGVDRTLRTVFTHDHFGPSTHQQAGLYAGLLVEPRDSTWLNSEDGSVMGRPATQPPIRSDGGPTSWKADIVTSDKSVSYREFALEFQDFQLAYQVKHLPGERQPRFPDASNPDPDPSKGYIDPPYAIGAPSTPTLIGFLTVGTNSVNYLNEPVPWRLAKAGPFAGDFSAVFDSDLRGATLRGDPITPLMRAYQGDKVQIRLLVGAHLFAHQFNLEGPTWFAEPSWKDSGYRSAQAMGLSEHFELLFDVPSSSAPNTRRRCPDGRSDGNCVDYFYSPSLDSFGINNGLWGLFRAYDPTRLADKLTPLPNNPIGPDANVSYATCPADAPRRSYNITAVTAQRALAFRNPERGAIVFNKQGDANDGVRANLGIMYVRTEDLDLRGRLRAGVPIEPLVLRANAGDCIDIKLTNMIAPKSRLFSTTFPYRPPLEGANLKPTIPDARASKFVGLRPQLLSFDAALSTGFDVGHNRRGQPTQVARNRETKNYQWYAGRIERDTTGRLNHIPVEFGALNLFPSDPLFQHINGLFGQMIIEPKGSTWQCGESGNVRDCYPAAADRQPSTRTSATVTMSNGTPFREFSIMTSDELRIGDEEIMAINYRREPRSLRYKGNDTTDFSCMTSYRLRGLKPETPVFTAEPGNKVRFRLTHPFGTGTSDVFTLHGHVWQRNPYTKESKVIGDNILSQWIGSRDNHGSTDHFDLVIEKAGGEGAQKGDYLYSVYLPMNATRGPWGLFRVGKPSEPEPNAVCGPVPAPGRSLNRPELNEQRAVERKQRNKLEGFIRRQKPKQEDQ